MLTNSKDPTLLEARTRKDSPNKIPTNAVKCFLEIELQEEITMVRT